MTLQADIIRDKRRHMARPDGAHDRLVRFLVMSLPVVIGVLFALMILAPLSPRGEVSFLLDRDEVQITPNRISVNKAMYRGLDAEGRPFAVMAGNAVQKSREVKNIEMEDLTARILLDNGPAEVSARSGTYNFAKEMVSVPGAVNFMAADGYRMIVRNVTLSLTDRRLVGTGRVEGRIPAGTFSADRLEADLQARTVSLIGNARLRMEPGSIRMP
ncbi:LPS export ABC transporter periplasmic protein LptC [Croceicoccus bisphenolivorans]|uniref:LPS export ABC transporter periplasmic protein LptC n=1 Tax=Croceicoccus bisphenolivorans TaxID=1783232 RepID=UPI00082B6B71|nr:LPS export ABC transporter periplasmic protein LptC [Croceicoccus bisphenolivorans]